MQAEKLTAPGGKKILAKVLTITKYLTDYYSLYYGQIGQGYRDFSIIFNMEELLNYLKVNIPELIFISSRFSEAEVKQFITVINNRIPGFQNIKIINTTVKAKLYPLGELNPSVSTVADKFKLENIPLNIELELTSYCNARCVFCPIDNMTRVNRKMEAKLLEKILDRCKTLKPSLIYLCGVGEPLLYPNIQDIVKKVTDDIGSPIGINTNGSLLTGELYKKLLDAGISTINISINGLTEDTYGQHMKRLSFKKVNDNIHEILKINPERISLQGVITRQNYHELPEMIEYWHSKGVKIFTFNQVSNKSGYLENFDEMWLADMNLFYEKIARLQKDIWISINSCNFPVFQEDFLCKVPVNFLSIDVEGNVLHCMHDFVNAPKYGEFISMDEQELDRVRSKRIWNKSVLCEGCNANKLDKSRLIWNGQEIVLAN
jgi:MoaA/NifB/PqqE/SkfB family radical SAM enzyme